MFQIKICGITSASDATTAAAAGADAVGLNFYRQSPRHVTAEGAAAVVTQLDPTIAKVGVFVDAAPSQIIALWRGLSLDFVQLHGHESPQSLVELPEAMRLIRVYRWGPSRAEQIAQDLEACHQQGRLPAAVLIDAYDPHALGGTGKQVNWSELAGARSWLLGRPLVLAGGLTPDNVADAIVTVQPAAVDTASGVEHSPRRKDGSGIERFVMAARAGWQSAAGGET